ncbi:GntR family transcriptional regulator [Hydrogenophaga sp.]|uniref:GntR family transcriptional regulator n=1 Tax=Hydrogenophaga sp. TaxID=1904254 RepID=UPI002635855D|nr:GntR family transcriptional regulator [Hydrogenophaga sp.]MCW5655812.1 GntR family transcriptional regulator [Hydrogenophaga sp.]
MTIKPASPARADSAPLADDDSGQTSVENATRLLREAIVQGQYGPGERIKITEAAGRLGVGTMPVREALRKLEGEGLVSITPNRGATVRAVNRQFVEDIYEVRTTLEVMIMGRCIERLTLARLSALEALVTRHREALEAGDVVTMTHISRTLHTQLFDVAGNIEATRIFQREWEIILALRGRFGYGSERLANLQQEFELLVAALRNGDVAAAERVIRLHNRAGMEDLLQRLLPVTHDAR